MKLKKMIKRKKRGGGSSVAHSSALEVAERIATELMTMNFGDVNSEKCERISMMKMTPDGERNLGGRETRSVVNVIERHLRTIGL